MIDKFTKYTKLIPTTKGVTTETAAELAITNLLPLFGRLPSSIISDRDPRFTAELWKQMWSKLDCKLRMTTAHRPQADGQTERANRHILEYLRHYTNQFGSDWDDPISLATLEFSINAQQNATGFCAYEILHGYKPTPPQFTSSNTMAQTQETNIETRWKLTRENLEKAAENMIRSQMGNRPTVQQESLAVGDLVLLRTHNYPQLRTNKLNAPFIGPFKIIHIPTNQTVELELPSHLKIHPRINRDQVKKYHPPPILSTSPPAPIKNKKGEIEYFIDKILQQRKRRGREEFLVRWLGYGACDDTWEPLSHLRNTVAYKEFIKNKPPQRKRQRSSRKGGSVTTSGLYQIYN